MWSTLFTTVPHVPSSGNGTSSQSRPRKPELQGSSEIAVDPLSIRNRIRSL